MLIVLLMACKQPTSFELWPSTQATTGAGGMVRLSLPMTGDERSFLLTARAEEGSLLALDSILDHKGREELHWRDWYTADEALTGAFWADASDVVVGWPVRDSDGRLKEGDWTVVLYAVDEDGNYLSDVEIDASIATKVDDHLDEAVLPITIAYTGDLQEDPVVVDAVDRAVERWEEVWAPYGLSIELSTVSLDMDSELSSDAHSNGLEEAAAELPDDDVLVLIGDYVDGYEVTAGFAGSIPGGLSSTGRATVFMSWLANAGTDGEFDELEIGLFGETMAHEVGHYMGLFHPVEMGYNSWDALSDTPDCDSASDCEDAMGDNLMFAYPVCDWETCVATDQLSKDQRGVLHRWTGAL